QAELIESIFREAHSLKGAARAVNLTRVETVCQALESVFAAWQRQQIGASPRLFDVLHETLDALGQLLADPEASSATGLGPRLTGIVQSLERVAHESPRTPPAAVVPQGGATLIPVVSPPEVVTPPSVEAPVIAETVRVPTARLSTVLLQAE